MTISVTGIVSIGAFKPTVNKTKKLQQSETLQMHYIYFEKYLKGKHNINPLPSS
jgi:hypothetical protein